MKKLILLLAFTPIIAYANFYPHCEACKVKNTDDGLEIIKENKKVEKDFKLIKKWVIDKRILKRINYAYEKWLNIKISDKAKKYSWLDTQKDIAEAFVLTLNAENGLWFKNRKSPVNSNWYRDMWLCQLNRKYHYNFIDSKDFQDPYKQIDYCSEVFQKWLERMWRLKTYKNTTFYWFNVREKYRYLFNF